MTLDLNDERITRYALGEMDDSEKAAFEKEIENNPEVTKEIEEIKSLAGLLTEELQKEDSLGLLETQKKEIEEKSKNKKKKFFSPSYLGVAASLLILAGVSFWVLLPRLSSDRSKQYAMSGVSRIEKDLMPISKQPNVARGSTSGKPISAGLSTYNVDNNTYPPADAWNSVTFGDTLDLAYGQPKGVAVGEVPAEGVPMADGRRMMGRPGVVGKKVERGASRSMATRMGNFVVNYDLEQVSAGDFYFGWDVDKDLGETGEFSREEYDPIVNNPFMAVLDNPLSTFSIDVDTASYSNIRRIINREQFPSPGSVRIEEMINYFSYNYPQPEGNDPFSVLLEVAGCPWNTEHRLVRIGLKGKEFKTEKRPICNLVFLLDVSGSMSDSNKLPLVKDSLRMLVNTLNSDDRVAIVVYAGASGLVLPSTSGGNKAEILSALDDLKSGGSTNGGQGIELAYKEAEGSFIEGAANRVILCTDGDFNVGITDRSALINLIEEKAKSGVFLSVLGYGMNNLKDSTMEQLADKGNGNYAYIDTLNEAKKVLVDQLTGTLVTIAKDVKIQVEFNPAQAAAYRLIGYENRLLAKEDFNDDTKDAGEIGAGHTVTALYEIVPVSGELTLPSVDPLKYQQPGTLTTQASNGELLTVKLRYKEPDGDTSKLLEYPVTDSGKSYGYASLDFKFASSVATFGMILRNSPYKGTANIDTVLELADDGKGADPFGYRTEFIEIAKKAKDLIDAKKAQETPVQEPTQ